MGHKKRDKQLLRAEKLSQCWALKPKYFSIAYGEQTKNSFKPLSGGLAKQSRKAQGRVFSPVNKGKSFVNWGRHRKLIQLSLQLSMVEHHTI